MPAVLIATSNRGKIREFKKLLGNQIEILTPTDPAAIQKCPRPPVVPEDGKTYYENGLVKALRYFDAYRMPVLADDSGLKWIVWAGHPVSTRRFMAERIFHRLSVGPISGKKFAKPLLANLGRRGFAARFVISMA